MLAVSVKIILTKIHSLLQPEKPKYPRKNFGFARQRQKSVKEMDNLSHFLSDCCHMDIFMVSNSLCTHVGLLLTCHWFAKLNFVKSKQGQTENGNR